MVIIELPCVIKALPSTGANGRRLVEVEASCEEVDSEGDLIFQKALLDSAETFVRSGHLDIDHISELGARMGIPNPESFIVGRPIEVKDIGKGRTSVVGEIMRSPDGVDNPGVNKYDEFWASLQTKPPVLWRASIYGFPKAGQIIDCRETQCELGATRYAIKGLDWRSLAFTRNPVNDKIQNYAKIIKSRMFGDLINSAQPMIPSEDPGMFTLLDPAVKNGAEFPVGAIPMSVSGNPMGEGQSGSPGNLVGSGLDIKSGTPTLQPFAMGHPGNMDTLVGQYRRHMMRECEHVSGMNSLIGFKSHFAHCCGADEHMADILAHALMYHVLLEKKRGTHGY